ncbi:hypothetical protein ADUPG1_009052 [Aduncisulcus paluster]|uniref:Uncharacterized protein n=1 Tax=Aduncisulcus paluster TaxID=2918883 RepID=A0ABQ5KX28_9EUKA|nr:hypothetical protein ADUPG1_009052 [Aduncisulcus paluster]
MLCCFVSCENIGLDVFVSDMFFRIIRGIVSSSSSSSSCPRLSYTRSPTQRGFSIVNSYSPLSPGFQIISYNFLSLISYLSLISFTHTFVIYSKVRPFYISWVSGVLSQFPHFTINSKYLVVISLFLSLILMCEDVHKEQGDDKEAEVPMGYFGSLPIQAKMRESEHCTSIPSTRTDFFLSTESSVPSNIFYKSPCIEPSEYSSSSSCSSSSTSSYHFYSPAHPHFPLAEDVYHSFSIVIFYCWFALNQQKRNQYMFKFQLIPFRRALFLTQHYMKDGFDESVSQRNIHAFSHVRQSIEKDHIWKRHRAYFCHQMASKCYKQSDQGSNDMIQLQKESKGVSKQYFGDLTVDFTPYSTYFSSPFLSSEHHVVSSVQATLSKEYHQYIPYICWFMSLYHADFGDYMLKYEESFRFFQPVLLQMVNIVSLVVELGMYHDNFKSLNFMIPCLLLCPKLRHIRFWFDFMKDINIFPKDDTSFPCDISDVFPFVPLKRCPLPSNSVKAECCRPHIVPSPLCMASVQGTLTQNGIVDLIEVGLEPWVVEAANAIQIPDIMVPFNIGISKGQIDFKNFDIESFSFFDDDETIISLSGADNSIIMDFYDAGVVISVDYAFKLTTYPYTSSKGSAKISIEGLDFQTSLNMSLAPIG